MGRLAARIAVIAILAVTGAVAAFATIAPSSDVEMLLQRRSSVETLPIPMEALLPAPASYIREERFQRGDTLPAFLARLGIANGEIERLTRMRPLHGLRPGSHVSAEVAADGAAISVAFLTPRDTLVHITPEGESFKASE